MALNVLLSKKPVALQHAPYRLFTQINFFTKAVLRIITPPMVNFHGTALNQSARALRTFGLKVTCYYGNQLNVFQFRRLASRIISSKHRIIILNLSRKGLHEHVNLPKVRQFKTGIN